MECKYCGQEMTQKTKKPAEFACECGALVKVEYGTWYEAEEWDKEGNKREVPCQLCGKLLPAANPGDKFVCPECVKKHTLAEILSAIVEREG